MSVRVQPACGDGQGGEDAGRCQEPGTRKAKPLAHECTPTLRLNPASLLCQVSVPHIYG